MVRQIPATFLVPDEAGAPLEIAFRHDALTMAVVDRDQFDAEVARKWETTGVYLLFGPSAEEAPGRYAVYVGKAAPGTLTSRIRNHIRNKEGWDRALLVTRSTADGFTSTDVGWLEGRLHEALAQATDAELLNASTPGDNTISAWDRGALDRVVATIQGVMRVLGYRPDPDPRLTSAAKTVEPATKDPSTATSGVDIDQLHRVVSAVRPGEWTTYGDVAEAIGTHPRGLGSHIRTCGGDAPEWRVLNHRGTSQPGFTWTTRDYKGSQLDVLTEEGVRFDEEGRADPDARVGAETLLARIDVEKPVRTSRVGTSNSEQAASPGHWLAPLYDHGALRPGAPLIGRYRDEQFEAIANERGEVEMELRGEHLTGSPSYVARGVVGYQINGWTFWRTVDDSGHERTLAQLREAAGD